VAKDHPRLEAYGTLDELSCVIGLLCCEPLPDDVEERLRGIQETLLGIGAVLADAEGKHSHDEGSWAVEPLEAWIDEMDGELPALRAFILPGGARAAALSHQARTVCRRAERRVRTLAAGQEPVGEGVLPYLNRLSDCLFVLARFLNARVGIEEAQWRPSEPE
jgi:cob(I)alamin adenosyltransferase